MKFSKIDIPTDEAPEYRISMCESLFFEVNHAIDEEAAKIDALAEGFVGTKDRHMFICGVFLAVSVEFFTSHNVRRSTFDKKLRRDRVLLHIKRCFDLKNEALFDEKGGVFLDALIEKAQLQTYKEELLAAKRIAEVEIERCAARRAEDAVETRQHHLIPIGKVIESPAVATPRRAAGRRMVDIIDGASADGATREYRRKDPEDDVGKTIERLLEDIDASFAADAEELMRRHRRSAG